MYHLFIYLLSENKNSFYIWCQQEVLKSWDGEWKHDECDICKQSSSDIFTVCGAHDKPADPEVEVAARAQELFWKPSAVNAAHRFLLFCLFKQADAKTCDARPQTAARL